MANNDIQTKHSSVAPDRRAELARRLRDKARRGSTVHPLSYGQQSLWFLHRSDPDSAAYNTAFAARIRSPVDADRLRKALEAMIVRHAALRTTFPLREGQPVQQVHGYRDLIFDQVDAASWPWSELLERVQADYRRPFELEHGPLTRVSLYSRAADDHVLLWTFHHVICDAWSMWLLMHELSLVYPAVLAGRRPDVFPVRRQFHDFVAWQNEMLEGQRGESLWQYWRDKLAGELPALNLPTDRPRPPTPSLRGASHFFRLDEPLTRHLVEFSKRQGATLYMTLLAAFQVLLHRYTDQDDIIVGSPAANRNNTDFENTIGFFANPLPLRTNLAGDPTFGDLLEQVRLTVLEGLTHQELPLARLIERLKPKRDPGRGPLFQVMFVMQRPPKSEPFLKLFAGAAVGCVQWGELTMEPFELAQMEGQFDLTWEVVEDDRSLSCVLKYNPELFDTSTIKRIEGHLLTLLQGVVRGPKQRISRLPILSDAEREQVLNDWNATARDYQLDRCLHNWIEDQVARTGDAIAVEFADRALTWRELNAQSNQLARELRKRGVGPDVPVGICVHRSLSMAVGLLAILKAGGAYVPLDPDDPADRLEFMLNDAAAPVILTQETLINRLPATSAQVVRLDADWPRIARHSEQNLDVDVGPHNLAYVIYTSGSTGQPKGAANTHLGICNRLLWMQDQYRLDASDNVLQKTPFTFDVSVWEFFWPLMTGARLVLARPGGHKERDYLVDVIAKHRITTVHFVPSMLRVFLHARDVERVNATLRRLICSGEALGYELQQQCFARIDAELHNLYGPTEAAIDVTYWHCRREGGPRMVPIGKPIANTQIYILDRHGQPTPVGVPGELHIGGLGLAREYWHRPELTAEKFVRHPYSDDAAARLYKTGDLCRWLPDGNIEYLQRLDQQVKIRGFRVELGEIEAALTTHPDIRAAVVRADQDSTGAGRLLAWIIPQAARTPEVAELRQHLQRRLPNYMIPAVFTPLDSLPLTASGKVNHRDLPPPDASPSAAGPPTQQFSEVEGMIAEIWRRTLRLEAIDVNDNFFDVGGNSLLLAHIQTRLTETFGRAPAMVEMFQYPTVSSMACYFSGNGKALASPPALTVRPAGNVPHSSAPGTRAEIAIVGMSGRFPGAADVDAFWRNLRQGIESIAFFSEEQLLAAGVERRLIENPNYVKAFGLLDGVEQFDAEFFGFSPLEAETMDVQHRLLLECAWSALEHAGHNAQRDGSRCGVFAGVGLNKYLLNNLYPNRRLLESTGGYQAMLGNDKDFAATRISYKLNLLGPSVTVQTACSTSLVAVHLACRSLQDGDCDMALAGGCSVGVPQSAGYLYQQDMILSPDGHCRAFDARAQGTVGGSGVGVVVLRRLDDALRDGDTIHAVIKGSAVNNDGGVKAGYTAPSIEGQAAVICEAIRSAGVDATTIGYVEAHGTGTRLGDPIEIAALSQAFRDCGAARGSCAIGSVKSNVGHLDAAAGVTGLIKAAFALRHQEMPPSLHFETPNPAIDFDNSPFYVNTALRRWAPDSKPRRAGVSSFGIGGTNAHVVLEEAPPPRSSDPGRDSHLILLSAKTRPALDAMAADLAAHLRAHPEVNLADVAFVLACGRRQFLQRRMLVCRNLEEAAAGLERADEGSRALEHRPVTFLFSGQGTQYVAMGHELYRAEPRFRLPLDRCAEILGPHLNFDLRDVLFPAPSRADDARRQLAQTATTQPALFALEYALAQLWMAWGVRPAAMIGHSIGEYVAACLAGVFSLEDALMLVARRGQLMQSLPPGAMLAVQLSEAQLRDRIDERLSIACINAPQQCVVSGPHEVVAELESRLRDSQTVCQRLRTSHAFHSSMMAPILEPFESLVAEVARNEPQVPFVSNLTGDWIRPEEATNPAYWAQHLRGAVRFADGLRTLLNSGTPAADSVLLEIGPGVALSSLANRHPDRRSAQPVASSLRSPHDKQSDTAYLLTAAGKLWLAGVPLDSNSFYAGQHRRRLPLPTYPFQRCRFWIDPPSEEDGHDKPTLTAPPLMRNDFADWFYIPSWKRSYVPCATRSRDAAYWLLVGDGGGLASALFERCLADERPVVVTQPGNGFYEVHQNEFRLDVANLWDWQTLLQRLQAEGRFPTRVVYVAQVVPDGDDGVSRTEHFFGLLHLTQALAERAGDTTSEIVVVTAGLHHVAGERNLRPELATLLGPVKVIGNEYPHLNCRNIDLSASDLDMGGAALALAQQVLDEAASMSTDRIVALRDGHRWVPSFEPVRLAPQDTTRLRQRGTYLITGGLGGIGLAIAEHLASSFQARLVLVSRTALPDRTQWDDWLAMHDESEPNRRKIIRLRAMEESGAEVLTVAADVANRDQLREVRQRGEAAFGHIDGIIHSAGVPGGGLIQLKTRAAAEQVLSPKVRGTLLLADMFADTKLDFFVLFSSVTSVLEEVGQVDYCAANAFLDSYVECLPRAICINWDTWQETGMAAEALLPSELKAEHQKRLHLGIRADEGIEAFCRILASGLRRVVVSTWDLARRRQAASVGPASRPATGQRHPRPQLDVDYVAPDNEIENGLADIWRIVLGIDWPGVHDDFFLLGGHSLLALQMTARIREAFGVTVSLRTIFEAPTIASLAEYVLAMQMQELHADDIERILAEEELA